MSRDSPAPVGTFVLVTCEHGGRAVPPAYAAHFRDADAALASHRGYDIGALGVALRLAERIVAPIVFATTTRLLVDLNRSVGHPDLFSAFTRDLPAGEQAAIIAGHHAPYRTRVTAVVDAAIRAGHRVLHVGVHTCTDELDGSVRDLDVALLFDPDRGLEAEACARWRDALGRTDATLRYRFNEPYAGADDGLTTALRACFPAEAYLGVEVEVRQGMVTVECDQHAAGDLLAASLASLLPPGDTGPGGG